MPQTQSGRSTSINNFSIYKSFDMVNGFLGVHVLKKGENNVFEKNEEIKVEQHFCLFLKNDSWYKLCVHSCVQRIAAFT